MKINYRFIISWILVILWMFNIYYLSNMDSELSNTKSKDTINTVVESSVVVTNKDISKDNLNSIVNALNKPLRKCMHSFVFFILVILFINAFNNSNIRNYKCYLFSIVLSFIYACFDEFHQLYVTGRTGQLMDIGIDMIGVLIGVLVIYIYGLLVKDRNIVKEKHSQC